ncbi:MFS transporter [Vineibacter terrae]|uniref:MFS transporter n=1 Tax=Vineibacter terrae TaxID=2586908 RepID=UPI002E34CDFF|nr:MFS transporter [Vineibacter terrae]HEX2886288.1 MFS transporter [Vineibacter terrae]
MQSPPTGVPTSARQVKIPFGRLVAYSTLQLPLAMAALPVVLNVPKFYGETLGLSLASLGLFLLVTRVIDALQDPVIGFVSDRMTVRRNGRLLFVAAMLPLLIGGFAALFFPPVDALGKTGLQIWLLVALVIVHLGYSGTSISYHAHGAELSDDYNERTRVTVGREVFGLTGMTLAVVLPAILTSTGFFGDTKHVAEEARAAILAAKAAGDHAATLAAQAQLKAAQHSAEVRGYGVFGLLFIAIGVLAALPALLRSPPGVHGAVVRKARRSIFHDFTAPLKNRLFRRLLLVFVVNGSALGIAVSVMLFYVEHVLKGTKTDAGIVLLTYFIAGAASVPMWLLVSKRLSKASAWFVGMALTAIAMSVAVFFGPGHLWLFVIASAITGLGLGADYGLPPSILADIINAEEGADTKGETGAYFGLWALATKLATAVGAALSLPVAAWLGFDPGAGKYDTTALVIVYIVMPVAVKIIAALLIWYIRIEAERPAVRHLLGGKPA